MLSENERGAAEYHIEKLLELLGHDVKNDEGLRSTPKRYVKFLEEYSYPQAPDCTTFTAKSSGMIVMTNIPVNSMCKHHLAPFWGYATIGYLPSQKMLGLSKLPRSVRYFAHRLQTQEELTKQILDHIVSVVSPTGVGVIIRANHSCMCARGAEVQDVWTTTTELWGMLHSDPQSRAEFQNHHSYRRSIS